MKMSLKRPLSKTYRAAITVGFGLIGFALNFLDLRLLEDSPFTISLLVGLLFPLIITLAWGWRYGLLAALAGGCQTMWWRSDGWGLVYSVPIFTLWIVWHGWWADRRHARDKHEWYESAFIVEIPFRIASTLGFYSLFRWLVSLNPPSWNQTIIWNYVPVSWVTTVAAKQFIEAYILILAAYVILSLTPVRRLFGLPPRHAQRDTNTIYAVAALMGIILWTADALVCFLAANPTSKTFWEIFVLHVEPYRVSRRLMSIIISMGAAVLLAHIFRQRAQLQARLKHVNRVLAAIRNVNQLIVKEKDQDRLLHGACDRLVETRGYYNVWIVLLDESARAVATAQAGMNELFDPMVKQLERGALPACTRTALEQPGIVVTQNPTATCSDCPLSTTYAGRSGLTARLEYDYHVYGLISASIPRQFAADMDEHSLFLEVAADIALALHNIEQEEKRRQAEQALRENELRYKEAERVAHLGSWKMDLATGKSAWSDEFFRICGYEPGSIEPTAEVGFTVIHPDDRERAAQTIENATETGRPYDIEKRIVRPDGTVRWVHSIGEIIFDDEHQPTELVGSFFDITERKQADESLRKSEAKYRLLVENLNEGMWHIDKDSRTVFVNSRMAEMLGYSVDEMLGKHLFEFMDARGVEIAEHNLERRRQGIREQHEFEFVRKDGQRIHTALETSAILDASGNYAGALAGVMDITQRKQMEEQSWQQDRLSVVGQLAAGISHDFNNLLTGIIGYAELLQQTDMPREPALTRIVEQGRRAATLTRQILDFSRQSRRDPHPLDLKTYMEESTDFIVRTVPENIQIRLDIAPGAYIIDADSTQLQQVVTNLAVNARDAMPQGGQMTFGLTQRSFAPGEDLPGPNLTPGEWIVLTVSDTGTGIPADVLSHIFEPFFTTKETGKGSGLGLAQVYGIVKQHQGEIVVDSQIGEGTTFSIYLPASPSQIDAIRFRSAASEAPTFGQGESILLVEDNPSVRDFVRSALEKLGYRILTAEDGVEALDVYRDHAGQISLVLTDAMMPRMDGFALLRALRSEWPEIKVLIMSGYPEGDQLSPEEKQNLVGWLEKPPSLKKLADMLRVALD